MYEIELLLTNKDVRIILAALKVLYIIAGCELFNIDKQQILYVLEKVDMQTY